jgi:hypothetical protein
MLERKADDVAVFHQATLEQEPNLIIGGGGLDAEI